MITKEQEEKIWRWCGFRLADVKKDYHYEGGVRVADWENPDNTYTVKYLPQFTLDNLERWAFPKFRAITISKGLDKPIWDVDIILGGGMNILLTRSYGYADNPVEAIALALLRVI